jgi:hypothetical protein
MVAAMPVRFFSGMLGLAMWTVLGAAIACRLGAQEPFPHSAHEGLFPLCAGCHAAAASDNADLYPDASLCGNCHDGVRLQRVRWTPPADTRSSFSHLEHLRATSDGRSLDCSDCHVKPGAGRMAVGALNVSTACAGCHVTHRADSNCGLCHAPAPGDHQRRVHAGCDGCHQQVRVDSLARTRNFCLLCHTDMKAHAAPRGCVECHPMGEARSR